MGIFGALTTAVTGMKSQAFALENVSGNIANAQTTAYKRIDTSFEDLIPDSSSQKQLAGNVTVMSRATNNVQGDVQSSSISTFMAINGDGYFVVQKPANFVDNRPIFDGINLFTRRGDFQPNKDGYLVNGAGYYLEGIPVDATTGNLTGSVPQLLKFQNDFLPAQRSTAINYRANLSSYPLTPKHDTKIPGSELLNTADFIANPLAIPSQPATIKGTGAAILADAPATLTGSKDTTGVTASAGDIIKINGVEIPSSTGFTGGEGPAAIAAAIDAEFSTTGVHATVTSGRIVLSTTNADTAVDIQNGSSVNLLTALGLTVAKTEPTNLLTQHVAAQDQTLIVQFGTNPPNSPKTITFGTGAGQVSTLAELNSELASMSGGGGSVGANGNITLTASGTNAISVSGTVDRKNFGMRVSSALPSNQTVVADDLSAFIDETIGGGAITCYDETGSPVNIQLRWAKTDSNTLGTGHTNTWNLFYQVNSLATGSEAAWKNAGTNFTFAANGQMEPQITNLQLENVTVDGVALGTVQMVFGSGGITQFSDPNGNVQVNELKQNGFAAGSLQSVSVNDKGRVVGSYSNGRTIDLAQITLANFNGPNYLKRIDGGAFQVTDESGPAVYGGAPGKIVNSSLEGSNADIADEFTKLIVTQQAYSANTRVISTSNQMVQDLLNMLR
jgi:flagellar hook protein FlgE